MKVPPAGRVGVVGASLGGAMMAACLLRRGFEVSLFERHGDVRREGVAQASMNLGLSRRGIEALGRLGLAEEVLRLAVPMTGRVIHRRDGGVTRQPYGRDRGEVIHAIRRTDINAALLAAIDPSPGLAFFPGTTCRHLDKVSATLTLRNGSSGREVRERFDFVVGADGVFSVVRRWMQRGEPADYHQEFLDWGWKELTVPPAPGGGHRLERNAFHLWPRGGSLLFAHPNLDGSFTCSLVLPHEGDLSFSSLATGPQVARYFEATFPDLVPLIPDLEEQFLARPVLDLVSIRTRPWHYRDRVVLLGDAAHAVVPFYAQGMNAAFEDCCTLSDCIDRHPADLERAFRDYQALRKPHTDALAEMSKGNFVELRDKVRSPWLQGRRAVDRTLHRVLGGRWMPLHARVTHTTVPYAEALALARRQERILAWAGVAAALGAGLALLGLF